MKRLTLVGALVIGTSLRLVGQVPASKHVYVVAEENHSYERLVGSSNMPYLNKLISQGALATQFYANQHSSLPNYFWLTAGQPITQNNETTLTYDVNSILRHVMQKGLTYKSYAQSLPYPGFAGLYYGAYMKRHAPLPYLSDMGRSSSEMLKHVGINQLLTDINNGNLPNFAFITPDGNNDMHNCPDGEASCQQKADQFLRTYIAPLLATAPFQPGGDGLLIIWSDEADLSGDDRCSATDLSGCGGRIVVTLVGPRVKSGYKSTTTYHHENLLKTMLLALGSTSNFPGAASTAASMKEMFGSAMTINIQSPTVGASVSSPVLVQATATGPAPITTMQVYVDDVLKKSISGATLNTQLAMSTGTHRMVVQCWDERGSYAKQAISVNVAGEASISGIDLQSPAADSVWTSPVHVVARAVNLSNIVSSRVYVDGVAKYSVTGSNVDTYLSLGSGTHYLVVQNWDTAGTVHKASVSFKVQ
jgi:Phosphoesterase family/Bacterial Ig domain